MNKQMIAVANPITRVVTILHKVSGALYEKEMSFNDLDEWNSFSTDKVYDVHFCYDEVFRLYITEYNKEQPELGMIDIEFILDVVYTDFDYRQAIGFSTLKLQRDEY